MAAHQFCRYALVGLAATCVHYAVLLGLVETSGAEKLIASIAGFCAAIPVNYFGQHRWVFRSRLAHDLAFPRYLAVTMLGLLVNAAAFGALVAAGVPYLWAQAVAICVVIGFNFAANRIYTFASYGSPHS